jgi:hypothetical protein
VRGEKENAGGECAECVCARASCAFFYSTQTVYQRRTPCVFAGSSSTPSVLKLTRFFYRCTISVYISNIGLILNIFYNESNSTYSIL